MSAIKPLLLISFLASLAESHPGIFSGQDKGDGGKVGAPVVLNRDDPNLPHIMVIAADFYNRESNDAYLFKTSDIHNATLQIVQGQRYEVDFEISRTDCRKRDDEKNKAHCNFQPPGPLQQTFQCHFEVWLRPWLHPSNDAIIIQVLTCEK